MTKVTKKTPEAQAPADTATSNDAAAPAAPAGTFPLPVDEFHGMGGEYVIENGVRRRVGGPPLPGDGA